jgi:GTP-binding protein Era
MMNQVQQTGDDALAPDHRSGFVSIVGRPNVGKSTLINAYLGQKVSIVTPKPQTTRRRLLGILTLERAQVIFVDTPGIHQPIHRLGEAMVKTAVDAIPDADVLLWVVDASVPPKAEDHQIAALLTEQGRGIPLVLALNKSDLVDTSERPARARAYSELASPDAHAFLSATGGENREALLDLVIAQLPPGPRFYPEDQVTDQTERGIAAELIREQVLLHTHQEVPHSADVIVDEFAVRSADMTYIHATVYVERASQKGIMLGRGGSMIKSISKAARIEIERLLDTRVYLELWVKVRPKWRQDEQELRRLGYR